MKKLASYSVIADKVKADVLIYQDPNEFTPIYQLLQPEIKPATEAILNHIRDKLIETVRISVSEILDPTAMESIKKRFMAKAIEEIKNQFSEISETEQETLAGTLVHEMLGLGAIELLLADPDLEEIVINRAREPMWVYHKTLGWMKTNVSIQTEDQIYNYASIIGRKVGRQITNLTPLMDAHLLTGDRVNATLFPVSSFGNTITIRKFARDPWTIVHFIDPALNTLNKEVASLIWLCMEYELSALVAGGTASGKTSLLNAMMPFIPPNHRIVSIEDTRELFLPQYLHWIPMTTREPNPEGKGEITMLDLVVNSLRMRPDRIVLGEIRRQREAEVLFEAMHTGHSVYSTLHADRVDQVKSRLINPPINLPEQMLDALHLIIVQYRHRRLRIRRTFEVAEVIPSVSSTGETTINMGLLYRWKPREDIIEKSWKSVRLFDEIKLHTGMTDKEIEDDMHEKQKVLQWLLANRIKTVNTVGKVVADYYRDKDYIMDIVRKNKKPDAVLSKDLLRELK